VSRTDPVAVVPGGSCGAGREIARTLASRGYAVVVVYLRHQAEAEAAVEEILAANGTALAVRADVADALDVERLLDETNAAFGGVDVVVHTASDEVTASLARELRARDITVIGVASGVDAMELGGLEPPTSWVRSRRSPN
jgi:3-oxoacyl-[acyl-carrier protein] reductase